MNNKEKITSGYLPDETPSFGKLLLYAIQQVIVMFPATVTVALITGFQISTTIFASGLSTICFILITKKRIPLYYGSSFAYLTAISSMVMVEGSTAQIEAFQASGILPPELISYAQCGIIASGLISIIAGLMVKYLGKNSVEKILPPTITGATALIIGLTLAGNALKDAAPATGSNNAVWIVSLVTLLSTIIYSKYLKGLFQQLPLLLGAITGVITAAIIFYIKDINLFRSIPDAALNASLWASSNGLFAIPAFTLPKWSLSAIMAIMPIAIATIPESTAHIYQLDMCVNNLAKEKQSKKKYKIEKLLSNNLIGDGICDMISGLVGGPAGTNYGENISTMAITKVYSIKVLGTAGLIAMIISCFTPLIKVIYGIPLAVIGGLEIYLFGAIAAQGIGIMIEKKVDLFDQKNIAVIASMLVLGIGGQYAFGGNIPFFGMNIPCVAGAAIFGIILNLILSINKKKVFKKCF